MNNAEVKECQTMSAEAVNKILDSNPKLTSSELIANLSFSFAALSMFISGLGKTPELELWLQKHE